MEQTKKPYITIALVFGGLLVTYLLAVVAVPRVLVTFTKAAPATTVSVRDSYVLGEKILAKADGKDKCTVNVFVMDATGKGVVGKKVLLTGVDDVVAINEVSNSDGKTSFSMTSPVEGQFTIMANVAGVQLTKGVKVTFRN